MARVVLVEATARDPITGAAVPVRLAGGGRRHYRHKGHSDWLAGVVGTPKVAAQLGFDGTGLTGGAIPRYTAVSFAPALETTRARLARLMWSRAPITVSIGDDANAAPAWTVVLAGLVTSYTIQGGAFAFTVADLTTGLIASLAPDTFAGTGGIEGGDDAEGRVKRRSWGRVFNVEGRLLDKQYNVYEFGDPSRPLHSIAAVKDRGREGERALVAWAGSPAMTLAALRAAVAPRGGAAVAPSIACAKWWTQTTGPITADLQGETSGGYTETLGGIAARIATAAGIAAPNAGAADAWRPGGAGLHIDSNETAAAALNRLLLPALVGWSLAPEGDLELFPIGFAAADETVTARSVSRDAAWAPVTRIDLGFRRNHRRHSDAEISAAVRADEAVYEDGTPVEELKPAEAGATKGAPAGTLVAGRPAQAMVDASDTHTVTILEYDLRHEDFVTAMDLRTLVDGQGVSTRFVAFRTEQATTNGAFTQQFAAMGAKTADGTGWSLNLGSVRVGELSLGERFEGFDDAIGTLSTSLEELGANYEGTVATVTFLRQALVTENDSYAGALLRAEADGTFGAFNITASGLTRRSRIAFVADEMEFVAPNAGAPLKLLTYVDGRWTFSADVYAKKLVADVVEAANIKAAQITSMVPTSFPDVQIVGGEVTIAELLNYPVGDGVDGRATFELQFTHDATTVPDAGLLLTAYVDRGSGYAWDGQRTRGARVGGGDIRQISDASMSVEVTTPGSVSVKFTGQPVSIGGGGVNRSWARDVKITVLRGLR